MTQRKQEFLRCASSKIVATVKLNSENNFCIILYFQQTIPISTTKSDFAASDQRIRSPSESPDRSAKNRPAEETESPVRQQQQQQLELEHRRRVRPGQRNEGQLVGETLAHQRLENGENKKLLVYFIK
jgi:hypothetical protein